MHRESSRNSLSRAKITQCDKIARISDIGYTHICDMRTTFSDVHFMAVVHGASCVSGSTMYDVARRQLQQDINYRQFKPQMGLTNHSASRIFAYVRLRNTLTYLLTYMIADPTIWCWVNA